MMLHFLKINAMFVLLDFRIPNKMIILGTVCIQGILEHSYAEYCNLIGQGVVYKSHITLSLEFPRWNERAT